MGVLLVVRRCLVRNKKFIPRVATLSRLKLRRYLGSLPCFYPYRDSIQVETAFLPSLYERVARQLDAVASSRSLMDDVISDSLRLAEAAHLAAQHAAERRRIAEEQQHALSRFVTLCVQYGAWGARAAACRAVRCSLPRVV